MVAHRAAGHLAAAGGARVAVSPAPLAGLTVLEVGVFMAAPFATMQLADLGARVIKVESPPVRDPIRASGPFLDGHSSPFVRLNRNKESVALDLKSDGGRTAFLRLVERADALVENLRPGAMRRLGLGYADLSAVNPRLVYASASGFGQDGPLAPLPGLDIMAQARSGLMSITGTAGRRPGQDRRPDLRPGQRALHRARRDRGAARARTATAPASTSTSRCWRRACRSRCGRPGRTSPPARSAARSGRRTRRQAPVPGGALPRRLGDRRRDHPEDVGRAVRGAGRAAPARRPALRRLVGAARPPRGADRGHRGGHGPARTARTWSPRWRPHGVPCAPINDYGQVFTDDHLSRARLLLGRRAPRARPGPPARLADAAVGHARRAAAGAGPLLGADTRGGAARGRVPRRRDRRPGRGRCVGTPGSRRDRRACSSSAPAPSCRSPSTGPAPHNALTFDDVRGPARGLRDAPTPTPTCGCWCCAAPAARRSCPAPTSPSSPASTARTGWPTSERITRVVRRLEDVAVPTVAAVEGFCVGGGLALAAACDLRLATESSRFGVPDRADAGQLPVDGHLSPAGRAPRARPARSTCCCGPGCSTGAEAHAAGFVGRARRGRRGARRRAGRDRRDAGRARAADDVGGQAAVARLRRAALPDGDDLVDAGLRQRRLRRRRGGVRLGEPARLDGLVGWPGERRAPAPVRERGVGRAGARRAAAVGARARPARRRRSGDRRRPGPGHRPAGGAGGARHRRGDRRAARHRAAGADGRAGRRGRHRRRDGAAAARRPVHRRGVLHDAAPHPGSRAAGPRARGAGPGAAARRSAVGHRRRGHAGAARAAPRGRLRADPAGGNADRLRAAGFVDVEVDSTGDRFRFRARAA